MRTIEIIRAGDVSVSDQLAEMERWLRQQGIVPIELVPVRIVHAQVRFRATFASDSDAERFRIRFGRDAVPDAP